MTKTIFIILAFMCGVGGVFSQGIVFEKEMPFSEVLAKSEKEQKLIFIDFYTPWCGPCKMMAEKVFPQKQAGDFYNSRFVCLTLNADAEENKNLVDRFVITSYPSFIFLDSKGEIIHRGMDGMTLDEFVELGRTAVDTTKNFKSVQQKVKNGSRTPQILAEYFNFIPYADEKEKLAVEYLNSLSDNEKSSPTAWMFFRDYVSDIKSKPFLYFAKHTKLFISQFGEEKAKKKMIDLFQNSYKENKKYFNSLKKLNPKFYNAVEAKLKKDNL